MKTIALSDEGYAEIVAALEEKGRGQEMLIELLTGRRGPESEEVKTERARLETLTRAAYELYGWSSWRSNGTKSLPAGSVFEPPGKDG